MHSVLYFEWRLVEYMAFCMEYYEPAYTPTRLYFQSLVLILILNAAF
jgi:hypothetical protein